VLATVGRILLVNITVAPTRTRRITAVAPARLIRKYLVVRIRIWVNGTVAWAATTQRTRNIRLLCAGSMKGAKAIPLPCRASGVVERAVLNPIW